MDLTETVLAGCCLEDVIMALVYDIIVLVELCIEFWLPKDVTKDSFPVAGLLTAKQKLLLLIIIIQTE